MEYSLLRKLAVRVACLHPEDRGWILAQLDSTERGRIDALLTEIDELGLAADPSVVKAVMSEAIELVSSAVLSDEYTSMVAILEKTEHPLWGGMVLQLRGEGDRDKIMSALPDDALIRCWEGAFAEQPVPPALAQCLRDYLHGQLNPQAGVTGGQEGGNERA